MKVLLTDTECEREPQVIEIVTIEELVEIMKKEDTPLVLSMPSSYDEVESDLVVEIYNRYRE